MLWILVVEGGCGGWLRRGDNEWLVVEGWLW